MQHNHLPCCKLQVNSAKKKQSGKQNKTLTCPVPQVMFLTESLQCYLPLLNRMGAGQVEVPAGQVNFKGSLPSLASNVLEPILHPGKPLLVMGKHQIFFVRFKNGVQWEK